MLRKPAAPYSNSLCRAVPLSSNTLKKWSHTFSKELQYFLSWIDIHHSKALFYVTVLRRGIIFFVYVHCFRDFMVIIRLSLTRYPRAQFKIFCTSVSEPFIKNSCFLFQILNSITEEVLDHIGTFRSPLDQLEFITKRFKEGKMTNFMHKNVRVCHC